MTMMAKLVAVINAIALTVQCSLLFPKLYLRPPHVVVVIVRPRLTPRDPERAVVEPTTAIGNGTRDGTNSGQVSLRSLPYLPYAVSTHNSIMVA